MASSMEQLVADFMPQAGDDAATQVKKLAAVAIAAQQNDQIAEGFLQHVIREGINYELRNKPERVPLSQYGQPYQNIQFNQTLQEGQRQYDYNYLQQEKQFLAELGLKEKALTVEEGKLSALNRSIDLEAQGQKFQQKQEKKKSFWNTLGGIVGFGASILGAII